MFEQNPAINTTTADLALIYRLLDDRSVSDKTIGDLTLNDEEYIRQWRKQPIDVDTLKTMPLNLAIELTRAAENQIAIQAGELFDRMVHQNKTFNYLICTNHEKQIFLKNKNTYNHYDIFKILSPQHGFIYGVYSDLFPEGQLDNRTHTDEEIKKAVYKLVRLGSLVPRDIVFGKPSRTHGAIINKI